MSTRTLTLKQRRFVDAYLGEANGNATKAAELAGYAGDRNTLHVVGSENLRKPTIQAEIQRVLDEECMSHAEVRARLSKMARASMSNCIDIADDGTVTFDYERAEREGALMAIKRIRFSRNGRVAGIELHDSLAALISLLRLHEMSGVDLKGEGPSYQEIRALLGGNGVHQGGREEWPLCDQGSGQS